ncbi:MAG TPA: Dyp-type peroxidase [Thermoleophilaceae bacterium]
MTEFTLPQFAIFAQGTHAHHFLEFDLKPGVASAEAVASFRRLRAPEVAAGGINLVVAFGARLWTSVAPAWAGGVADFREVLGAGGHTAPATQHDAWIWISASEADVAWDHARAAVAAVADVTVLAAEQPAFTYRDGRDMTGFVDGSANPPVRRAAEVALVPPGKPGAGGSHVLAMRWVHDLDAFGALSVPEQERVIGRTKPDSIELSDADKPATAHIALAETTIDGEEQQLFRRSVPYGSASEYGLCFVAFSADRKRFDRILARMFDTAGSGVRDRLLDYSRPVSGACYFAPSLNALNELGGPED